MNRQEVIIEVHKHIDHFFRPKCIEFSERVEAYAERLIGRCEKQRAEMGKRLGDKAFHATLEHGFAVSTADEILTDDKATGAPYPGWVWQESDDCWKYLDRKVINWCPHWRPADDTNPLLWFPTAQKKEKGVYVYPGDGMDPQDQTLYDSVLLSIAHDRNPKLSASEPHIFAGVQPGTNWLRDAFCREVWNALENEGGEEKLIRAWQRTAAVLPNTPTTKETGAGGKANETIAVDLNVFSEKKCGSYPFLVDLLNDLKGDHTGVSFDEKRHGTRKNQPDQLKDMLIRNGLNLLAEAVKKVRGSKSKYALDINASDIDVTPRK